MVRRVCIKEDLKAKVCSSDSLIATLNAAPRASLSNPGLSDTDSPGVHCDTLARRGSPGCGCM